MPQFVIAFSKNLTLICLIVCLASKGMSQNDMFKGNPVWTYNIIDDTGPTTFNKQFEISGDSIINGIEYMRIDEDLLRSDSGLVFIIPEGDSVEKVLYNFNLTIGDYFLDPFNLGNPKDSFRVGQIDTLITLDGQQRKHFIFDSGGSWIEGIGGTNSLTRPVYYISLSGGLNLLCVERDDEYLMENEISVYVGDNMYVTVGCGGGGIMNVNDSPVSIPSIYPNPVINQLRIEGLDGRFNYSITDIQGRCQLTGNIQVGEQIDLFDLLPGAYHLILMKDKKQIPIKFMKLSE